MIRRLAVGLVMLIMATFSGHAHGQFGMTLDQSEQFCQSIYSGLVTNLAAQPDPAVAEQLLRNAQAQANRLEGFLIDVEASIGQLMAQEDGPNMELVGFLEQQAVSIEQAIDQAERILDCWGRILDITLARQPGQPLPGTGSIVEAARPYRGEFEAVDALMAGQRQRLAVARAMLQDPEILIIDEPTPDVIAVGPIFYGRLEGGFELPTSNPAIGDTQTLDLGTGGGLAGEIGVRFPLDGDWSLDVGGRLGWSSVPVDAIVNQNGGSSPLDGDDELLSGLFSLRINRHFDNGIDLFGDVGLGIGDRRMDVVQNGAVVFDQSASVFVWEIGGGATIDLCQCGVAAGIFARYREADGFDARTAFSTLPIGARRTVTLGATLVIELGY